MYPKSSRWLEWLYFPILCKNNIIFHKTSSSESTITTCCTIWICCTMICIHKIMGHVSQFVSVVAHHIICSYIHSWNQYTMFIISTIMYVLCKHNRIPYVTSTPTVRVDLSIKLPIIGNLYRIKNQQFVRDHQNSCIFITSKIFWLFNFFNSPD